MLQAPSLSRMRPEGEPKLTAQQPAQNAISQWYSVVDQLDIIGQRKLMAREP